MKFKLPLILAALVCGASLSAESEPAHSPENFGKEKTIRELTHIRVENYQGQSLGRIKDLGIDLVNGRIIEVFVVSGDFLSIGGKIVAVPPLALTIDQSQGVCYLDTSVEDFKAAPALNLSDLPDSNRTALVSAAYHRFGQEPYFLEPGESSSRMASRPKVALGIVQRSNKVLRMPVNNLQNERFGTISGISFDIAKGTIRNVVIASPGFIKTKSIVPATALSFNSTRDALVLDQTKTEFDSQPQIMVTEAANGQKATSVEESYKGPRTNAPLEQGRSYRDIDRTALITRNLRAAKIKGLIFKVGTLDGRVTLRGTATSEASKTRAGVIAISASRLEVVDNQLTVTAPAPLN